MKIYKVRPDTSFRMMYPPDEVYESESWEFKCHELVDKIPQFDAYWDDDTSKPLPDIAYLGMSAFAFKKDVAEQMTDILESAGEMLPFYIEGELWYYLNVMEKCESLLDEEKTKYKINQGNIKLIIEDYVFKPEFLSDSSIFKIPQDNHTETFCADRRENDEQVINNFFCAVHGNGFSGLKFTEVFSDE
ncbi:hypothetical protein MO867_02190 [Microbulbifer sp. OS29]|uniref:Uncharacterized protein n=1 Tax=Microbulbifer okhotskensis TaxID=2926617 RepID=A0A9X2EPE6_9GAMM|nr:hypothetical protein [Microbulbifer okhotskensis]MCO1333141.1 hypothetical protein [Microbulbifer okhotskensis]